MNQKLAYIYALTAIFLWSTVATAIKISLRYYQPLELLFVSTLVSVIAMMVILVSQGQFKKAFQYTGTNYLFSAALGFLNPFLYYVVLFEAYNLLQAQIAQPLNYTWPLMLVLLSAPLLGQKLRLMSIVAILISFSGVFLISSEGNLQDINPSSTLGIILAVGSSVIWALFWIFNVKDTRNEVIKLFMNFLFGLLFISIAMIIFTEARIINLKGLLSAAYLGLFEMGITFVLWLKAMQFTESNDKISNLVYLSPFVSLIFIHFILGENIFYTTIAGLILIISGIVIQQYSGKKSRYAAKTK